MRLCYLVATLTAITLAINIATPMPGPSGGQSFVFSDVGAVLGKPALFLLALMLFLYVACEVGVWNWLAQHLIAQGVPESRALNILSLGFALGLLIGRVVVSQVLRTVSPETRDAGVVDPDGDHHLLDAAHAQRHRRGHRGVPGRASPWRRFSRPSSRWSPTVSRL